MALLPVETALSKLLSSTKPIVETETLPLAKAAGRILAKSLTARLTQPPFNASAMDGYALRHADLLNSEQIRVIGESSAGHLFDGPVGPGQAVRIFTGAPVPQGADTVLLQEDAKISDNGLLTHSYLPEHGRHIRPKGQDFADGEIGLHEGEELDATRLMLAASMNHPNVTVFKRPRVAIMATGDELMPPGSTLAEGQIVASNNFAIQTLAEEAGANVIDFGIFKDTAEDLKRGLDGVKLLKPDLLVTLGGASVGTYDLVQDALKDAGMVLDFWRIAMRPGKPLMAGNLNGISVLGLPGNPVSSFVCALLFMQPLLRHMAHRPHYENTINVTLGQDLPENDKRQDHIRARLTRAANGTLIAEPFSKQDSSMMKILAQSGCLIIRQPFAPAIKAGETARAILLRSPQGA